MHGVPRRHVDDEGFAIACGWGEVALAAMATDCGPADAKLAEVAAYVGPLAYRSIGEGPGVPLREVNLELPDVELIEFVFGYSNHIARFRDASDGPSIFVDILEEKITTERQEQPLVLFHSAFRADLHLHGAVLSSGMHDAGKGVAVIRPSGARVPRIVGRASAEAPWEMIRCTTADHVAVGVLPDERIWFVESTVGASPKTFEAF